MDDGRAVGAFDVVYAESMALAKEGRFLEADEQARLAQSLSPQDWRGHALVGSLALIAGDAQSAILHLQHASLCEPDRPEVLNNLGAALRAAGRASEAESHFARAVTLAPAYDDALKNLAALLNASGRCAEALAHLQVGLAERGFNALELADKAPPAKLCEELGKAYWGCGDVTSAIACLRYASSVDPDAVTYELLAGIFVQTGRSREAVAALADAIACAPDQANLYLALAEIDPRALTTMQVERLHAFTGEPDSDTLANAHFALARMFDEQNRTHEAFDHFATANVNARALRPYDEGRTLGALEHVQQTFSRDFLARHAGGGHDSDVPVFIVGMPRSGTTLVEQILAAHPSVRGGGELEVFARLAQEFCGDDTNFAALGARYAAWIRDRFADALRVTDKMPANYRYAGLIHLALPHAKIVHVVRDPLDTCFSCFTEYFPAEDLAWSFDLAQIGRYYRAYARLMEHWRGVLSPGALLEVRYEDLVTDPETQARRIVEHCELPWDERCLAYYDDPRPVQSASALQVRRPVYRTSIGRSRRYAEHLRPLIDALGEDVPVR